MIISISGMDGMGKSTQCKNLNIRMPHVFTEPLHINQSPSFPKLTGKDLAAWWFNPKNKEEFVDVMFASLYERKVRAKELEKDNKIVVLDKGFDFYLTRVKATLLSYGTPLPEIEDIMLKALKKYNLSEKYEDLKFVIVSDSFKPKTRIEEDFSETRYVYESYQNINIELLNKELRENTTLTPIEYIENEPEKMAQKILRIINDHKNNVDLSIFKEIIDEVKDKAVSVFGQNLELILLTGSTAKGNFIENWSDFDFHFVFDHLDHDQILKFTKLLKNVNAKIGTTFYEVSDFKMPLRIDKRSIAVFYEASIGKTKTIYNPNDFKLPYIPFEDLMYYEESNIADVLNTIKRQLFYDDFDVKKLVKNLAILEKITLRTKGLYTEGYEDTFSLFNQKYNIDNVDIVKCIKNINDSNVQNEIKEYGFEVLNALQKERLNDILEQKETNLNRGKDE